MPLESTILYYDTAGNLLRTVTKGWNFPNQLGAECTTLPNGKTSGVYYQYEPYALAPGSNQALTNPAAITTNLTTDVAEYDYGLVAASCAKPSTTPTRETVTTYANFSNTPLWPAFTENGTQSSSAPMVDRPATVIKYQNGIKVAETDFSYDQTAVASVSPTPVGHDETNYKNGSSVPRGNVTTATQKCFQGSTTCADSVTRIAYDTTGQPISVTDANGNQTNLSYADNYTTDDGSPSGNTNTYLTTITQPATNGISHIENFQWDFNKGQLRTLTDENNKQTLYQYADPWWRLTKATFPDGGSVTKTYQDAGPNPTVTTTSLITASVSLTSTAIMDGLGHLIHSQLNTDPDGVDTIDTKYDGLGRVVSVSNPYRSTSDPTYGLTTFSYDSLGRKTVQVQPDGNKLQWCYNNIASSGQTNCAANASTQTNTQWIDSSDEVGNHWQRTFDAFGRMTSVLEPNGSTPAPSMETDYSYDGLDNLMSVVQKGNNPSNARTRSFSYDSLSRLVCASNPENSTAACPTTASGSYTLGTTGYTYDANGNLSSKTSLAPNQTGTATVTLSYCYDALNRLSSKAYTSQSCPMGSAIATYFYDQASYNGLTITNGVGRRTGMSDQAGAEAWSYDPVGRVLADQRATNSLTNTFGYTYNFDGSYNTIGYPGKYPETVTYTQSAAGRPIKLVFPGVTYSTVSNVHYAPNGALCSEITEWGTITQIRLFNNRFQPLRFYASTGPSVPVASNTNPCPTPASGGAYQDLTYSYVDANGHNNGNLIAETNNLASTRSQTFSYDSLNRLSAAQTTSTSSTSPGNCWAEAYSIDAWGNLYARGLNSAQQANYSGCISNEASLNYTASTKNQIVATGYSYDAAGNLFASPLGAGTNTYAYDAENHLLSVNSNGVVTSYTYDGDGKRVTKSSGTIYWYGAGSAAMYTTDLTGNFLTRNFYFNGERVARQETNNWVDSFVYDHLGNTRYMFGNVSGGYQPDFSDFFPYGGELVISQPDTQPYRFTGKERDAESGLDNFGARYNSSSMGRFMTPDSPSYSNHKNPQSWNLYAYSLNNPVTFRDADGHKIDCANNVAQCQADAAASTGNAQAAARVTTETTKHGWWIFKWSETSIKITGDISSFRALSPNASKLADLVTSDKTITVNYSDAKPGTWTENGEVLHGGSTSRTPSQGWDPTAWIDPNRTPGAVYDQDAVDQGIPQANTAEEFGHEVLGHIWGELFGGAPAGTRANMRDSIAGEDAVRALDPTRGQKGLESHHNYQEATPDPPKPQQ